MLKSTTPAGGTAMTAFDILFTNYLDATEMLEEMLFQDDDNLTRRWSIIADTLNELL